MKLTSKGRYAVMALTDLALYYKNGPVSLRDISLRQNISLLYLEQIFLKLRKYKIVESIRGTKGGYRLSRKASDIRLSEILSAVDENVKTVRCIKHLKKGCNGKSIKCNTHKLWDELDGHINSFFEKKLLFLFALLLPAPSLAVQTKGWAQPTVNRTGEELCEEVEYELILSVEAGIMSEGRAREITERCFRL